MRGRIQHHNAVIPAKAGIQLFRNLAGSRKLDPGFRRNDELKKLLRGDFRSNQPKLP